MRLPVAQFLVRSAPLLGGIRGQLAAIDGEVVRADQPQSIGVQQHIGEHGRHFVVHRGDEIGNGAEVRPGVGRRCHELHVALTGCGQFAAGYNAFVVAKQHDFEQHLRIVRRSARLVVALA